MVRLRPVRPAGWWPDALLVAGFVALTLAVAAGAFLGWDVSVYRWCDGHLPRPLYWVARAGFLLGQSWLVTWPALVVSLVVAWRRRSVRPVLPVAVAFVLTFVTLTALKAWTDRAAPHATLAHPERFGSGGVSYPSGHLTNAIVWYGVLALLLAPWLPAGWRLLVRVGPPAVLCVTSVYLGFHWVTDTVAGLLLGLLLDRVLRRIPWDEVPLGRRLHGTGWDRPAVEQPLEPVAAAHHP
ncbi:MAG TPA: phosphatase PAP2 family protein [Rugosimonospora sp.]|nr:phosphatase PAP2 family protein [Rugosimonospora sp.]